MLILVLFLLIFLKGRGGREDQYWNRKLLRSFVLAEHLAEQLVLKPQLQGITRAKQNQGLLLIETTGWFGGSGIHFHLKLWLSIPHWRTLFLCFALLKLPKYLFIILLGRHLSDLEADIWQGVTTCLFNHCSPIRALLSSGISSTFQNREGSLQDSYQPLLSPSGESPID